MLAVAPAFGLSEGAQSAALALVRWLAFPAILVVATIRFEARLLGPRRDGARRELGPRLLRRTFPTLWFWLLAAALAKTAATLAGTGAVLILQTGGWTLGAAAIVVAVVHEATFAMVFSGFAFVAFLTAGEHHARVRQGYQGVIRLVWPLAESLRLTRGLRARTFAHLLLLWWTPTAALVVEPPWRQVAAFALQLFALTNLAVLFCYYAQRVGLVEESASSS